VKVLGKLCGKFEVGGRFIMPRVSHFEFYAQDAERAVVFYRQVFGWQITKWEGPIDYWLVTTGGEDEPGINGAIARRTGEETTYNVIDVPSFDEFAERIVKAGGKVVSPKQAVPGVGYAGYFADTEGVIFGIMEEDPSAQ
jgi:predicted enzyme related to lactoylglutathione lyase